MQHLLQSEEWAKVRANSGHRILSIGDVNLIVTRTPWPFKSVGYIPQVDVTKIDFSALTKIAKTNNLSHVLIDPVNDHEQHLTLPANIQKSNGLYYRATTILDLRPDLDSIQESYKNKYRYNLRLATKSGISVTITNKVEDLNICIDLILQTAKRQKYFGRNAEYYRNVYSILNSLNKIQIAIAWHESVPLVAWMVMMHEDTIYYGYSGSSELKRELKPAYKLAWEVSKWAKELNYSFFDLWGVDLNNTESGFTSFKLGFGGRIVQYAPSFDFIVNPVYYRIFKVANSVRWLLLKIKKTFIS